jgi:hypothetical protein
MTLILQNLSLPKQTLVGKVSKGIFTDFLGDFTDFIPFLTDSLF